MTVLFGKRATCGNIFRCNEENLDQENKIARRGEKTQKQVLMKKKIVFFQIHAYQDRLL